MARRQFDAFLPSGAIEESRFQFPAPGIRFSPKTSPTGQVPRTVPDYIPSPLQAGARASSKPYMSLHSPSSPPQCYSGSPISPPFSRSASADDNSAALIEDWRKYTQNLREQFRGERAHLVADRARADEVMIEGQELWDKERAFLKDRIAELEAEVTVLRIQQASQHTSLATSVTSPFNGPRRSATRSPHAVTTNTAVPGSIDGTSAKVVRQESGRNPDGSPFYAPAPQNPSRTFEISEADDLRVDNMITPQENPIRVTSKALSHSDFDRQTPTEDGSSVEGSVVGDSIDISQIHSGLEGVSIKASAVDPTFVAKVLSPNSSLSPAKRSPHSLRSPPTREAASELSPLHRTASHEKQSTLEVIAAPENRRLTMNAGHTPNHSIHHFDLGDSGNATPTQKAMRPHAPSLATGLQAPYIPGANQLDGTLQEDDGDFELTGPLTLLNDGPKDELFLQILDDKLKSIPQLSPTDTFVSDDGLKGLAGSFDETASGIGDEGSIVSGQEDDEEAEPPIDEMPRLRVKASTNFGKPFGKA